MSNFTAGVLCNKSSASEGPPQPTVTIIVPVHNGGKHFQRCLTSLTQAVPCPLELIVVVDGDRHGSWQTGLAFGARTICLSTRRGPAYARNVGARAARGNILFFVDADVEIPPDAVGRLVSMFQVESDLAAVFGSYDDEPAAANFLSQYRNLLHHHTHQMGRENASTFWGACGAIRREVFEASGGFNETYREASIEDIELGYRLARAGHSIRLCKKLQVKHLKRWDVFSLLKTDVVHRAVPWTRLILASGHFPNDLSVGWKSRASVALVCLAIATSGFSPWWPQICAAVSVVSVGLLTLLNRRLYCFFWRKRSLRFALGSVPLHWLYYGYSGLAFAYGFLVALFSTGGWGKGKWTPGLAPGHSERR